MTTLSARLGLKRHTTADDFHIADYFGNWGILDQYPGQFVCTSVTRPTWASAQAGQSIYETDTELVWRWNGTAWVRPTGKGFLARAVVTSDVVNTTSTYATGVTVNATVPAGSRRVQVTVEAPSVTSTASFTELAIFRDATQLTSWANKGGVGATVQDQDEPEFVTVIDGPSAGTYAYVLKFRANSGYGGTSTLKATPTRPIAISVVEI